MIPPGPYSLLSKRDVAAALNVSENCVKHWLQAGKLTCVQIGGPGSKRFVRAEELERFASEHLGYAPDWAAVI